MSTFSDSFTGTANPLGGVWAAPAGSPGATPGLQKGLGGPSNNIQGAYNSNGGDGLQHATYFNSPTFVGDQTATCTVGAFNTSDTMYLCVRMQSGADTYYGVSLLGSPVLTKRVAGVNSTLATGSGITNTAGDVWSLQVSTSGSNAVFVVQQNSITIAALNYTDTTSVITGGQPGLAYTANNTGHASVFSSFSAVDTGGGATGQPPMYTQRKVLYFI